MRAWVNDLFQFINVRPDLFILSAYWGAADTGVYAVTISITSLVWILSQPLASVVLPRTASLEAASLGMPARRHRPSGLRRAPRGARLRAHRVAVVPVLAVAPLVWGSGFGRIPELGLIVVPGVALLGVGPGDGGRVHRSRRGEPRPGRGRNSRSGASTSSMSAFSASAAWSAAVAPRACGRDPARVERGEPAADRLELAAADAAADDARGQR